MSYVRSLAKGAVIMTLALFLSKLFTYLYRVIIVRGLGIEAYGIFSIAFALVSAIGGILLLGFPNAIERYVPFHKKDERLVKGILLFTLQLIVPITLIATILLILNADLIAQFMKKPSLADPLKIFAAIIFINAFFQIYSSIAKAFKKIEYSAYTFYIAVPFLNFISILVVYFLNLSLTWAICLFVASNLVGALILFAFVQKDLFDLFSKIRPVFMRKEIILFSFPLVVGQIMSMLIGWTDTIMLGYFLPESTVGIYNIAMPTAMLLGMAPIVVTSMFLPIISEFLSKGDLNKVKESYSRVTRWILVLNLPLFLILMFFGKVVISLFFGNENISAVAPLIILSIGYFIFALVFPLYRVAELFKDTKMYLYVNTTAALLNIVLNLILIPRYGMIGAAVASLVALTFIWIVYYVRTFQKINIHQFDKDFLKIVLSATIPATVIYFAAKFILGVITPIWLIPLSAMYGLVYLCVIYKFGLIKQDEIELIKEGITKYIKLVKH